MGSRQIKALAAWVMVACISLMSLPACSSTTVIHADKGTSPQNETKLVKVGSQADNSNRILASLVGRALQNTGLEVEMHLGAGTRETLITQMSEGKLNVVVDYTGSLLQYLDPKSGSNQVEEIYGLLQDKLPGNIRALAPSEAREEDTYVITPQFAKKYRIKTLIDVGNYPEVVKLAGDEQLAKRPSGPIGLKEHYGLKTTVIDKKQLGKDGLVPALLAGKIQMASLRNTNPAIAKYKLLVLEDPSRLIIPQQVVVLVTPDISDKACAQIEKVMEKLNTAALIKLNAEYSNHPTSLKKLVDNWLLANSLVKP